MNVKAVVGLAIFILLVPHALFLLQPYFVDERAVLVNALHFAHEVTLIPLHTRYPTFYSYLAAPLIGLGTFLLYLFGGAVGIGETAAFAFQFRGRDLVMPARLLSFAALTGAIVILGAFLSHRLGKWPGYSAAAAALATPALLSYGSYGLPDALLLALSALSLVFAMWTLDFHPQPSASRSLLLSAFFSGLAISTKYNAFASVAPIAAACVILFVSGKTDFGGAARMAALSAAVCVGAFLLGSPAWIAAPQLMFDGLRFELKHAATGHLGFTGIPILGQFELLAARMPILLIGSVIGAAFCIKNRAASAVLPAVLVIATIGLSALSEKQSLHYLYPMIGGLCYFWAAAVSQLAAHSKTVAVAIPSFCIAAMCAVSFGSAFKNLRPNTTDLATVWLYQNVPTGSSVASEGVYVPQIFSMERLKKLDASRFGGPSGRIRAHVRANYRIYNVVPLSRSTEWLKQTRAEYIITSDAMFARFFEHGTFTRIKPGHHTDLGRIFRRRRSFYKSLLEGHEWAEIYSADTGNGPKTLIYRRAKAPIAPSR